MKPARLVGAQWDGERLVIQSQSRSVAAGAAIMVVFEADDMPATAEECRTVGAEVASALLLALEGAKRKVVGDARRN